MTVVKRIFFGILAILGTMLLGATAAWLFVDDATLVSLLVKRLEAVSATNVDYRDGATISRTWTPELSVNNLLVVDTAESFRLETSSLRLQVSLSSLLTGRVDIDHLLLGDTRVHVLKGAADDVPAVEEQAPPGLSAPGFWPVLHELQIAELSIVVEGNEFQVPAARISELSLLREPGTDTPRLSARIDLADEKFALDVRLTDGHEALKQKQLPFIVTVQSTLLELSAEGRVDVSQAEAVVEAKVASHVPDLKKIPGLSELISVPGELTASARLSGSFAQLVAEDLSARWTDAAQSRVTLDGSIGNVTDLEGIELALAGQLGAADWLTPLLPDTLGALDAAELVAQVSGDQSRLTLRKISFKALSADKLDLSLTGQLDLTQLAQTPEAENLDLQLAFNAPTTRAARILIFDDIPEFGAITGAADVRSERGAPALENVVIRTRDEPGIEVDLSGRIEQFPLSDEPNTGYDLHVTMSAAQTALMAERAGFELPLSGPLALSYRIEGDTQALELNRIELSAGDKSKTLIEAQGHLHFGDWDRPDPIASMDLAVQMGGRDTGFLSAWTKQDFPALAYQSQGRLHTVDGRHRIDDYKLVTPPGEPLDIRDTGSAEGDVSADVQYGRYPARPLGPYRRRGETQHPVQTGQDHSCHRTAGDARAGHGYR